MHVALITTDGDSVGAALAGIDAEIDRLTAERDALIAASSSGGNPELATRTRRALATRLFGVNLPAGVENAQIAAFAETAERYELLTAELHALGLKPLEHRWKAGGLERRALEWTLDGTTHSLHSPRSTGPRTRR
jgi:hypothetical protein